jgi:hypothetical protein
MAKSRGCLGDAGDKLARGVLSVGSQVELEKCQIWRLLVVEEGVKCPLVTCYTPHP